MAEQEFWNKERQLQKDKLKFLNWKIENLLQEKETLHHYYEEGTSQIELQEEDIDFEIEQIYEEITSIKRSL